MTYDQKINELVNHLSGIMVKCSICGEWIKKTNAIKDTTPIGTDYYKCNSLCHLHKKPSQDYINKVKKYLRN